MRIKKRVKALFNFKIKSLSSVYIYYFYSKDNKVNDFTFFHNRIHLKKSFFESNKHFIDIRSKKFLGIEKSFVDLKKISLMQINLLF